MSPLSEWIVVVDSSPSSTKQMDVCRSIPAPDKLQGAVQCDDVENHDSDVCKEIHSKGMALPAFCHVTTNQCVSGLLETEADIRKLAAQVSQ